MRSKSIRHFAYVHPLIFIRHNSISISLHYFDDILLFHLVWVSCECVNWAYFTVCGDHSRSDIHKPTQKHLPREANKNWMNNCEIYAEHTYIFMRAYSYEGNEHFWWNPISLLRPAPNTMYTSKITNGSSGSEQREEKNQHRRCSWLTLCAYCARQHSSSLALPLTHSQSACVWMTSCSVQKVDQLMRDRENMNPKSTK